MSLHLCLCQAIRHIVQNEVLDRLTTILGHPTSLFSLLGKIFQHSQLLDEDAQSLYSEMLGQLLDRLTASPNIVAYYVSSGLCLEFAKLSDFLLSLLSGGEMLNGLLCQMLNL